MSDHDHASHDHAIHDHSEHHHDHAGSGHVEGWFDTKRRMIAAVIVLVVVALLLAVLNQVIKTHKTTHQSFTNVTKLDIKVGNGSLHLINGASDAIDVDRKIDYTLRGPSLTQKIQGDTLVIRQNCSGLHIGECSTAYTIAVPNRVATTIKSDGGSVSVDSIQGPLSAQTSGGKLQLSKTFGDLNLKTDSGQVTGKDLSSLQAQVTTKGGKISLDFAVAPTNVNVTSNDADVSVLVPKGNTAYNVNANSANSKSTVDVKNDSNSPRNLKAQSTNGKVEVSTD